MLSTNGLCRRHHLKHPKQVFTLELLYNSSSYARIRSTLINVEKQRVITGLAIAAAFR